MTLIELFYFFPVNLPETEPVDTALYIFDDRGKLVDCAEEKDTKGVYSYKLQANNCDWPFSLNVKVPFMCHSNVIFNHQTLHLKKSTL